MDSTSASFSSKMSKVEASLFDLNKEIITAASFLQRLKLHSTKIVQELNNASSPSAYLKEFVQVNSFLLKYLGFLTEINCKFEMMHILDNDFKSDKTPEIGGNLDNIEFNLCDPLINIKEVKNLKSVKENSQDLPMPNGLGSSTSQKSRRNLKQAQKLLSQLQVGNSSLVKSSLNSELSSTDDSRPVPFGNQQLQKGSPNNKQNNEQNESSANYYSPTPSQCFPSSLNCHNENIITEESVPDIQSVSDSNIMKQLNSSINSVYSCISNQSNNSLIYIDLPAHSTPTEDYKKKTSTACNKTEKNLVKSDSAQYSTPEETLKISAKLGEEFDVIIEHIKSPSEFYVHIINSRLNLLIELEKRLKLIPVDIKKINSHQHKVRKDLLSSQIGAFALYYSKCDEAWYRAKVTDWCLTCEHDFVYIFLFDYGESKCVSVETLQPMPEVFKIYPAFAQRCHLHGVFPVDMKEESEFLSWGRESSEKMRYLIEKSNKLKIKIVSKDRYHPSTSLPVTLWLVDRGNECVNKLLINSKYAIENSGKVDGDENPIDSHLTGNKNLEKWDPMKEDFKSYQNSYELNVNDPAAMIYGYVGKDYDRVCREFGKTGKCFKGNACKKEHVILNPSGFTSDKEEVYRKAFNAFPAPSPNDILHVQVTCFWSVNQFCCFPYEQIWSGDEETLSTLLKFMNNPKNLREMRKLLIPPSTGQIVIAQYTDDDSWYRAKVLDSQPENDAYTVMFVDYGNKESLPLSRIRAIEPRYLHLPFQAMQCFIFGVKQNPLVSLEEALEYLNKRIAESEISIEVISKLPGEDISLFVHVFDQNRKNLGEDLIAKGYAVYKKETIVSNNCEVLPG